MTCGRESLPLIHEVSTMGTFEPKPSVYNLCVYRTYGRSYDEKKTLINGIEILIEKAVIRTLSVSVESVLAKLVVSDSPITSKFMISLDSFEDKNSCSFHCVDLGTMITRLLVCGPSTS